MIQAFSMSVLKSRIDMHGLTVVGVYGLGAENGFSNAVLDINTLG
jgi:hypothetical protein